MELDAEETEDDVLPLLLFLPQLLLLLQLGEEEVGVLLGEAVHLFLGILDQVFVVAPEDVAPELSEGLSLLPGEGLLVVEVEGLGDLGEEGEEEAPEEVVDAVLVDEEVEVAEHELGVDALEEEGLVVEVQVVGKNGVEEEVSLLEDAGGVELVLHLADDLRLQLHDLLAVLPAEQPLLLVLVGFHVDAVVEVEDVEVGLAVVAEVVVLEHDGDAAEDGPGGVLEGAVGGKGGGDVGVEEEVDVEKILLQLIP